MVRKMRRHEKERTDNHLGFQPMGYQRWLGEGRTFAESYQLWLDAGKTEPGKTLQPTARDNRLQDPVVLVGGHFVSPKAIVDSHRYAQVEDVLISKKMVRVEVYVSFHASSSCEPFFTTYWEPSRTISDLRKEFQNVYKSESDIIIADSRGRLLHDDESVSCTITKSGARFDGGWVLCQLKMRSIATDSGELGTQAQKDQELALMGACHTLPYCDQEEEEEEEQQSETEHDKEEPFDANRRFEGLFEQGQGQGQGQGQENDSDSHPTIGQDQKLFDAEYAHREGFYCSSSMTVEKLYQHVDMETADMETATGLKYIEGAGGTKFPTFHAFREQLPADEQCAIPDSLPDQHALHDLLSKFSDMGLAHESGWRKMPLHFHSALQSVMEGMDPLNTELPERLATCFGAMNLGVSFLSERTPLVPLDYKQEIKSHHELVDMYRKQMLSGEEDEDDLDEVLKESLQEFDDIFSQLLKKHDEATLRSAIPEEVRGEVAQFENSLSEVKTMVKEAKVQVDVEIQKSKQTQLTQDDADAAQSKAQKQITWTLELNRLAQQAAERERTRLDEEIARLQAERRHANSLLKSHQERKREILELARTHRLAYQEFCRTRQSKSEAIATRIHRAKNQVATLEKSRAQLETLRSEFVQSLAQAESDGTTQVLDTGLDAFEAYCGVRKFHFIEQCSAFDVLSHERKQLKKLTIEKKLQVVLSKKKQSSKEQAKLDLEKASNSLERQQTKYDNCEARLNALKHKRSEDKDRIQPVLAKMKSIRSDPKAPAAVLRIDPNVPAAIETPLDLLARVGALEYPEQWEQEYKDCATNVEAKIREELEEEFSAMEQALLTNE